MKRLLFAVLILFGMYSTTRSQSLSGSAISFMDSLLYSNYSDSTAGINFIVSVNGIPEYVKCIGLSDIDAGKKLQASDPMPIGSVSKQFAAITMLTLAESGKISLDDEITKFLPDYNSHGKKITIENLLTHTSGIPSFTESQGFADLYYSNPPLPEKVSFFMEKDLLFDPSVDWSYSNSGFFLLSRIIESVTGIPYTEYAKKNVLLPAGIRDTYFGECISEPPPNYINGYGSGDSGRMIKADTILWSWTASAGDVVSTIEDMGRWMDALSDGKIISAEMLSKAWCSYVLKDGMKVNYGYGWGISEDYGEKFIFHGGSITGFVSQTVYIPAKNIYVAAISNNTSVNVSTVVNQAAARLAGIETNDPPEISMSIEELRRLTGVYEMNRSGARLTSNFGDTKLYRHITEEGGQLFVQPTGKAKSKLIPFGKNSFYTEKNKTRFVFYDNSKGSNDGIMITSYPLQMGPVEISPKTDIPLPEAKKEISVTMDKVKDFIGTFELQPGFNVKFTYEDGKFFVEPTGQTKEELFADSDNLFYIKSVDVKFEFIRGSSGKVDTMKLTQGGVYECKRIE